MAQQGNSLNFRWLIALTVSLTLLVVGHWTGSEIQSYGLGELPIFNHPTHTDASVWVRICSLSARLVLGVGLLRFLLRDRTVISTTTTLPYLQLSQFLLLFYNIDLLLDPTLHLTGPYQTLALLLLPLLTGLSLYTREGWSLSVLTLTQFVLLTLLVHKAEVANGPNNAFTILAVQLVALSAIPFLNDRQDRFLRAAHLAPAFGYLFPLAEKLLLNPKGWLSGNTLQAWAAGFGYDISSELALALSLNLLAFQGSMLWVLFTPRSALLLYPAAILFHLIAGIILDFPTALNPWITSLILGWSLSTAILSRKDSPYSP